MAGWSTKEHKLSTGLKGLKSWAKAEGGRVMTSSGWTVDFFTDNFDVKHLHIVTDSTPITTLHNLSQQRRNTRKNNALLGHNNAPVSGAGTNSMLALTEGSLAAWGAKIAKKVNASAHTHIFHGHPQWNVTTELKGAAFLTHNATGPLTIGVGVTATVTCEKRPGNVIVVCHFVAAGTSVRGSVMTGNALDLNNEIAKKREARFKQATKADNDVYDLSALFG